VLEGATLNPGDLDWSPLETLGDLTVHPRTAQDQVPERARGAAALLVNKLRLPGDVIAGLPELRYVGILATGHDRVDVAAARARGVVVTNVPRYGTASVAQATFALLLELVSHTGSHAAGVRAGRWSKSDDFCYWDAPLVELEGLRFGIVGLGEIGRAVARIATAFGMDVVCAGRPGTSRPGDPPRLVLEELLGTSDVVSLHLPLTPRTEGMIDAGRLAWMKPSAFLLNTARGALVDAHALAAALHEGRIAGAGLDVLDREPPPLDHPLLHAPRCVVTPHVAWATTAARRRLLAEVAANLAAWQSGEPRNVLG